MEKISKIIKDIHLYSDRVEMLIKSIIWIISWIGGVFVLASAKKGLGSAYFIFTLSLLMEFVPQIKEKKEPVSRFLHATFCFCHCWYSNYGSRATILN